MRSNPSANQISDTEAPNTTPSCSAVRTEDIYLRNYDPYQAYDLALTVTDPDGRTAFEKTYHFRPGQHESVEGVLPPGEYEVTTELDNRNRNTVDCRVGPSAEETIHIELGNGIASITEGLFQ
jgi:hypothetical protein